MVTVRVTAAVRAYRSDLHHTPTCFSPLGLYMSPDIAGPACFRWKCVLTGSTSDLELVRLIHGRVATDGDQHQVANSFVATRFVN